MTSLFDRGYQLLNRATAPAALLEVRYLRGATVVSDALQATLSSSAIEQVVDGEVTAVDRAFRWSLKASELVIDGERITPARSDLVEWFLNGITYVFELLPSAGETEGGAFDPRHEWIPFTAKLIEKRTSE